MNVAILPVNSERWRRTNVVMGGCVRVLGVYWPLALLEQFHFMNEHARKMEWKNREAVRMGDQGIKLLENCRTDVIEYTD